MLNLQRPDTRSHEVVVRSLTDDPYSNTMALGCPECPHFSECGGLSVRASLVDCLELCCGDSAHCTRVCRHKPQLFVQQMREVGGLNFEGIPRTSDCSSQLSADIVPLIYHGSSRTTALAGKAFALRLSDLIDFKRGKLHFETREALCQAYSINPTADLVLTGVNHDHRIEPWWTLGEKRIAIIKAMKELGIALVTTPNFSLLLDNPRTDDLHAMKRIAITFEEFQREGLPCALHPNGRTYRDFERWSKFIAERSEIETLAYEFITGSGQKLRTQFHLDRLADLVKASGRALDIVVRGDPQVIPFLRQFYRHVIYIETNAFMKTLKRRRAERLDNDALRWPSAPTIVGETVDTLLIHNVEEQIAFLRATYYGCDAPFAKAA
ncbi:MAG: DUF4417 domain-containing protein [Mesorhizobium sp.]|nr:MAG: DUF4417 domain-containing protein [Mesorhizobium sp.]